MAISYTWVAWRVALPALALLDLALDVAQVADREGTGRQRKRGRRERNRGVDMWGDAPREIF